MKSKTEEERASGRVEARALPAGWSLRRAAHALAVPHSTLHAYLKDGAVPARYPDLAVRIAQLDRKEDATMLTKVFLPDEVLAHFGIQKDPFTDELDTPEDIVELKDLAGARRKILHAIDKRAWVVITGPVGSGKSTMLKRVRAELSLRPDVALVEPAILEKQHLSGGHLCEALVHALSGSLPNGGMLRKSLAAGELLRNAYLDGRKVALLIDEAHLLRLDALLALKRLHEFEVGTKKVLAIILVGQPRLATELRNNVALSEVGQRTDVFEIGKCKEVTGYLRHKLDRAGWKNGGSDLFDAGAIRKISAAADTPLSINNLAAAALIAAWTLGEHTVTDKVVTGVFGGH